ncbi:MAG: DUF1573 domain-containing protein [Marinifilaceae bacterium]|nr:DUF1573 domain-containing protein [Marinifilaceae bacterium]
MKSLFIITLALISSITTYAQKTNITFNETSHYFGNIPEREGEVKYSFICTNNGTHPLTISEIRTGCKCTTCEWEEKSIAPGESGTITAIFDPEGLPGKFIKSIAVFANTTPSVSTLTIRGYVIPQKSGPFGNFPVKMGDIRLSADTINIDGVNRGIIRHKEIEIINSSKEVVELATNSTSKNFVTEITPATLQPLEKGKLTLKWIVTDKEPLGPQTQHITIIQNGKESGAIVTNADVYENFSIYKDNDYSLAPKISLNEQEFDMGQILVNTILEHDIIIKNSGIAELQINKIVCDDPNIAVHLKKGIKSGKSRKMTITVNGKESSFNDTIVKLYTNDPENPVVSYRVKYETVL